MADWRKLLGKKEGAVLPWLGGARVRMKDREVRVAERPDKAGWYRFEVEGRNAKALAPAEPALEGLPKVKGHIAYETLFPPNAPPERIALMPDDEPALFASCTCRRWHNGALVVGELDFEGESEEEVRRAFADKKTLEWVPGVPSTLRAAFAWATMRRTSIALGIPCSPREAWPHTAEIAEGGEDAVEEVLRRLAELRAGRELRVGGRVLRIGRVLARIAHRPEATLANAEDRAYAALDAAGARVTQVRKLAGGQQLEVHYDFAGSVS